MNKIDCLEKTDFTKSYDSLTLFPSGPLADTSNELACGAYGAKFRVERDLSPLFPYINAVADHAHYYEKPVYIKFVFAERLCAFYSMDGAFAPVSDMAEAMEFLPKLLEFLVDISARTSEIVPNHKKFKPSSALDIYRLLPGSNCRKCGYTTCMAYAAALSRQRALISGCPHMARPIEEKAIFPVYDRTGNVVKTISFDIDSGRLFQTITQKEARIQDLQTRLAFFEQDRNAGFDAANASLAAPLTKREIEVLRHVSQGATNREISNELRISQHTVKSHIIHIFNKIGVNDRASASAWGAMHGLVGSSEKCSPKETHRSC